MEIHFGSFRRGSEKEDYAMENKSFGVWCTEVYNFCNASGLKNLKLSRDYGIVVMNTIY